MKRNTKLKICGIRSIEEILELQELDIDYFGCIFARSPRQINTELAYNITKTVHKKGKKTVGVFVDESIDNIMHISEKTGIDRVQLHGSESPAYCSELMERLKKSFNIFNREIKIWKAFSVKDKLPYIKAYLPYIEYPLFDAKGENKGGNGITFDWSILKGISNHDFILAGGLSTENILEALKYNPVILDVNSKVEINGRKDKNLIKEIIRIIKY